MYLDDTDSRASAPSMGYHTRRFPDPNVDIEANDEYTSVIFHQRQKNVEGSRVITVSTKHIGYNPCLLQDFDMEDDQTIEFGRTSWDASTLMLVIWHDEKNRGL